jgi:hypothetical protein
LEEIGYDTIWYDMIACFSFSDFEVSDEKDSI